MKYVLFAVRFSIYMCFFLYEMVKANFLVVKLVLSPRVRFRSAAIRYSSQTKTMTELILLTNSITLTPGTLVMDVNPKTGEMLVHVMSGESVEQIKEDLHNSLEKRLLWAMRGGER
jgi:multicomponent Na+:H+ antiporter subunit E